LLVLALVSPLAFAGYNVEVVLGSEHNIAFHTSLEFNGSGLPTIAYADRAAGEIGLATRSVDSGWSFETVAPVVPDSLDHAIDTNGNILVCYTRPEGSNRAVYAAERVGSTWSISRVARGMSSGLISCAYDAAHVPCVAYGDGAAGKLYFAKRSGGTWSSEVVAQRMNPWGELSLAFDTSSPPKPAIAFVDNQSSKTGTLYLKLARKPGSKWSIETAATSADAIRFPSLAFNPVDGTPKISHLISPLGGVAATYLATTPPPPTWWTSEPVANAYSRSLLIEATGTLHIGITGPPNGLPKQVSVISKVGGVWTPVTAETSPNESMFTYPSIAIDPAAPGHPALCYSYRTDGYSFYDLRYAWWVSGP
jgi:hypothetical protein